MKLVSNLLTILILILSLDSCQNKNSDFDKIQEQLIDKEQVDYETKTNIKGVWEMNDFYVSYVELEGNKRSFSEQAFFSKEVLFPKGKEFSSMSKLLRYIQTVDISIDNNKLIFSKLSGKRVLKHKVAFLLEDQNKIILQKIDRKLNFRKADTLIGENGKLNFFPRFNSIIELFLSPKKFRIDALEEKKMELSTHFTWLEKYDVRVKYRFRKK